MNADKTLNDILVKLFNDLMEIEEKCLISGEFMNISGNDMHIIEAIGLDEPKRMSEVVRVSLTDSGVRAYEHHARFHSNMIHDIKESLTDQESEILIGTLGKLVKFFQKKYESYLKNKK